MMTRTTGHNFADATTHAVARRHGRVRGFTLVELIVAVVIAAALAGAATVTMRQMIRSRDRSQALQEAHASVYAVTQMIARDLANTVRDSDGLQCMVRVINDSQSNWQRDEVLVFARSLRRVRHDTETGEGGVYEVQYRLVPEPGSDEAVLWQRRDPVPDEYYDGGGVAVPLATHLLELDIQAYDGAAWVDEWDSDVDGMPYALRVTCRGRVESSSTVAWARASVAIDRPPLFTQTSSSEDGPVDLNFIDGAEGGLFGGGN